MKLTDDQIHELDESSYLFLPSLLSRDEATFLKQKANAAYTRCSTVSLEY